MSFAMLAVEDGWPMTGREATAPVGTTPDFAEMPKLDKHVRQA
jgi:hypothetical protein